MAKRKEVVLPYSNINKAIAQVLLRQKYLLGAHEELLDEKKVLVATLRYERRNPVMTGVKIISKPSLRVYTKASQVHGLIRGQGITLLSTSKGIMTEREAQKEGVGGELLFKIW